MNNIILPQSTLCISGIEEIKSINKDKLYPGSIIYSIPNICILVYIDGKFTLPKNTNNSISIETMKPSHYDAEFASIEEADKFINLVKVTDGSIFNICGQFYMYKNRLLREINISLK